MPSFSIRRNDQTPEWRKLGVPISRVSGSWRPCKQVHVNVNGVWTKVFDLEISDPFDGSGSLDGTLTPGQAVWKVYAGSFTKGSGVVTGENATRSIAGIETGTDKNIQLEIDSGNASLAGTGVSFWIQDQSNWWGAQIYYQAYSTVTPGTTVNYNVRCANYTYTVTNTPGPIFYTVNQGTLYSISSTGTTWQLRERTCRGDGFLANVSNVVSSGCAGVVWGCTPSGGGGGGGGAPCTSPNFTRNCGPAGGCQVGTCFAPPPTTNFISYGVCPSPQPASISDSPCGGGDSLFANGPGTFPTGIAGDNTGFVRSISNLSCSNPQPQPGNCTHTQNGLGPWQLTNVSDSFDIKPSTFPCPSGSGRFCQPFGGSETFQPTTNFSTYRKARIVRSVNGTVSQISATPDSGTGSIADGTTLGGLMTELTPTQVRVTAYSGAARTGAQPTLVYNIPAGTSKSTKHGILVSDMPAGNYTGAPGFRGYTISRFKATYTTWT